MKTPVYNQQGKEVENILLPKEIFGNEANNDLIYQVVLSQTSNQRKVIAHTKGRGEVSGGGKKPWKQKGTGRARVGSIRSPLWKGGGVTFGPTKERNFKKKINKNMRKKALFQVFSAKAKENLLIVIDKIVLEKAKTKQAAQVLLNLSMKDKKCLIALEKNDKKIVAAFKNIPSIKMIEARNINILDLLSYKYLIMEKKSIKAVKEMFLN